MICSTAACTRTAEPGYSVCTACLRSLLHGAFGAPEPKVPEWVRRMQASRGVVKDYTRS